MKKTLLTLAALSTLAITNAQIEVKEGNYSFSTGSQNALSTTILENSKDDVMSEWKSFLKDFKNEKVKEEKGELFADNVVIKEWSNNTVDIFTTFEGDKNTKIVKMHVAFDLGGAYLKSNEQKEKYAYAEKMIKDFAIKMTKKPLMEKLKDAEKVVAKAEDDQKGLEKDNKGFKSDIESNNDKIKKANEEIKKSEEAIKNNEEMQVKKKAEIEANKKLLDKAKKVMESVN